MKRLAGAQRKDSIMAKKKTTKPAKATKTAAAFKPAAKAAASVEALFKPTKGVEALQQMFKPFEFSKAPGLEEIKAQLEKFGPGAFKGLADANQAGKDNVEAVVKSSQIFAKAAEELNKAISTFAQSSLELNVQAGQALLGAKSLQDLVEVQQELARSSFDHFITGSSKISDMAMKVTNEALEPIQSRVNHTIEKLHKAA